MLKQKPIIRIVSKGHSSEPISIGSNGHSKLGLNYTVRQLVNATGCTKALAQEVINAKPNCTLSQFTRAMRLKYSQFQPKFGIQFSVNDSVQIFANALQGFEYFNLPLLDSNDIDAKIRDNDFEYIFDNDVYIIKLISA